MGVGKGMGLIYLAHRIRNEHLPQMLGTKRAMGAYLCSAEAALLQESDARVSRIFPGWSTYPLSLRVVGKVLRV